MRKSNKGKKVNFGLRFWRDIVHHGEGMVVGARKLTGNISFSQGTEREREGVRGKKEEEGVQQRDRDGWTDRQIEKWTRRQTERQRQRGREGERQRGVWMEQEAG